MYFWQMRIMANWMESILFCDFLDYPVVSILSGQFLDFPDSLWNVLKVPYSLWIVRTVSRLFGQSLNFPDSF